MWKHIKHLFIPCEENSFKPHFLEKFSMGIMLLLVLLTFTMANIQSLLWIDSEWMVSTVLPSVIVELTNKERDGTFEMLHRNALLEKAATLKAQDMAQLGYFAHYSPAGITPWHWFDVVGYDYLYAGENLAVHFTDSGDVVDAWMESPTHRANIMNGNYTEIGVGTARGEYKGAPTVFVVQLFGTARETPIETTDETTDLTVVPETVVATTTEVSTILPRMMLATTTELDTGQNQAVLSEQIAPESIQHEIPTKIMNDEMYEGEVMITKDVPQMRYDENNSVLGFASTSRTGIPAVIDWSGDDMHNSGTTAFLRGVTQPSLWLQYVYGFLALIAIVSLLISIMVEWRRQNPKQIVYAGALLTTMAFLFYIHITLTVGVIIV